MKKVLLSIALMLIAIPFVVAQDIIPISDARLVTPCSPIDGSDCNSEAACSTVTVQGVVINGSELGAVRYIQDATGGIAIFNTAISDTLSLGMEITVTGQLIEYRCLQEISDEGEDNFALEINSEGNVPEALALNPNEAFSETNEGRLVRALSVTFADAGFTFEGNTNYTVADENGNTYTVRIDDDATDIVGMEIPQGFIDVIGVMGQYQSTHQLLPRTSDDIAQATGIKNSNSDNTIKFHPNPANTAISVQITANQIGSNLHIMDISGKVIKTQTLINTHTAISVSNLSNGVYFIQIGTQTSKLVVNR
jgi:hypothetical protein